MEIKEEHEVFDLVFECISESYMNYERYSERLKERINMSNFTQGRLSMDREERNKIYDSRKVHSLGTDLRMFKNKKSDQVVSPFIKSKHYSFEKEKEKEIVQDFHISLTTDLADSAYYRKVEEFPLTNPNSSLNKQTDKISLPRRKKIRRIFEEFLVIGIEGTGLEYIDDLDEMLLSPKIIFNFPNCLEENELKFNIKFLKNFCFNEGILVKRIEIKSDEEFDQELLEKNIFSSPTSYFCLVQQVSPEDIQKYFIIGCRFLDFYITHCRNIDEQKPRQNRVNLFLYEKTYLFIACEPLCKLFTSVFQAMISVKKLNFLNNMSEFSSVFRPRLFRQFCEENAEKSSQQVREILEFYHRKSFPLFEEEISFKSDLNSITSLYKYPNPFNESFLAIEWLSKFFFSNISSETLYNILIRILLEHSVIFVSDNIQDLTATLLGFSYLILPFKWPFIIIPNLPSELRSMIESPVPFLIGILADENEKKKILLQSGYQPESKSGLINFAGCIIGNNTDESPKSNHVFEVVSIYNKKIVFESLFNSSHPAFNPHLKNLKNVLAELFEEIKTDYSFKSHEKIYKRIFDNLKSEIAGKIEQISRFNIQDPDSTIGDINYMNSLSLSSLEMSIKEKENFSEKNTNYNTVLHPSQYNLMREKFEKVLHSKDKSFGKIFAQTQLFLNYLEDVRARNNK